MQEPTVVQHDAKLGVNWFQRGADQGDIACLGLLARCIDGGIGFDKPDPKRALEMLQTAADNGYRLLRLLVG